MLKLCTQLQPSPPHLYCMFYCSILFHSLIGCVLNTLVGSIRQKIRLGAFKIDWFFVLGKTQHVTVRKTFIEEKDEG